MDTETRDRLAEMKSDIALLRQRLETLQWNLEEIETDEAIAQEVDIISGPGVQVSRSGKTYVVSAEPGETGGAGPVACKVTGGNSLDGYYVDLYPNGPHNSASGSGQLRLLEIAGVSTLPVGAWVLGWPGIITVTGGSE